MTTRGKDSDRGVGGGEEVSVRGVGPPHVADAGEVGDVGAVREEPARGPVRPYPESDTMTSCGFSVSSSS